MSNQYIKSYDHPSQIPNQLYEGYIWCSDAKKPEPLGKNFNHWERIKSNFSEEKPNPFIIEGLLYFKEGDTEKSIVIRHTGKYHIKEIDLKKLPSDAVLEKYQYMPHRLDGVKKLKFQQLWLPEEDLLCGDMEVLKMKTLLFTGFMED